MKLPVNIKTTIFGILAFVMVNGETLGIPLKYQKILEGVSIALLGFSSKDKDVTGVGEFARKEGEIHKLDPLSQPSNSNPNPNPGQDLK